MIHFLCLHNTAQAGTHAAGHMLFQGDICLDLLFFRVFFNGTKHGHRSASEDHVCLQMILLNSVYDIALRADTAVFRSNIYGSVFLQVLF